MGLFSKKEAPVNSHPAPVTHSPVNRHSTRHSADMNRGRYSPSHDSPTKRSGLFHRRSSSLSSSDLENDHTRRSSRLTRGTGGGGLFHRDHPQDPSIMAARERLAGAEHAEREADRAVVQARAAVHDAREHIKRLETEAAEEARLAKIKQRHASEMTKRSKPLGRY